MLPLVLLLVGVVAHLTLSPVPVEPVAWQAPANQGFVGPFAPNSRLAGLDTLPIGDNHGPEAVAIDGEGRIYAATGEGRIVRLGVDGTAPENWAQTGGRPLGIKFDRSGNLLVADALRGLLAITPDAQVSVLASEADGLPIAYADDLDVASDGKVYFSDASTKFGAREFGGSYAASLLDLLEHGGHGRLLVWDPATRKATTLARGIDFANGVALSPDETHVLVSETGAYRVLRHWIAGRRRGRTEPVLENLPGFPDNVSRGLDGRFWVALISPRNAILDALSGQPGLRKAIQRLPAFLRPDAEAYGHVVAFDGAGKVLASLQDPAGAYRLTSSVLETRDHLYIGSLVMPALGRLPKEKAGLP
ncbi:MAG: SMP-30/gluconolactonase/LRE family protein [Candidatus Rokuibacteriota bacterium]